MKHEKIKVHLYKGHYVHVYLFDREQGMYDWLSLRYTTQNDFQAICYYTQTKKKLADVLFCKKYFNAPTVSHECFHIVRYCHERFAIGEETQAIFLEKMYEKIKREFKLKKL